MQVNHHSRRKFLQQAALAGITAIASPPFSVMPSEKEWSDKKKEDSLTFLFQGDSITDGNRGRNKDPNHIMGHGYAFSIASRAGAKFAQRELTFYNRGISGNRATDLLARWQKDVVDLKPDVLSILVGVNDTELALKQKDAQATAKFEYTYRTLLQQTKETLPTCLMVLCEPFITPVGRVKEQWNEWQSEMGKKQEVVQSLAKEYHTVFVPLQKVFNKAVLRASAEYWVWDGIHPTVAGHELITQEWLKRVSNRLPFLKELL
jgi:lysophospholipase L1-like esterase